MRGGALEFVAGHIRLQTWQVSHCGKIALKVPISDHNHVAGDLVRLQWPTLDKTSPRDRAQISHARKVVLVVNMAVDSR